LRSLAWWLAATNRWRTAACAIDANARAARPCLALCSRFRRRRGTDSAA
jgi:hypothetical protein